MPCHVQEGDSTNLMDSFGRLTRLLPDTCINVNIKRVLFHDSIISFREPSCRMLGEIVYWSWREDDWCSYRELGLWCVWRWSRSEDHASMACHFTGTLLWLLLQKQLSFYNTLNLLYPQSGRAFMSYYTFGLQALQNVSQVVERIGLQEMNVGELWSKLVEYSTERFSRRTKLGFFSWLITSLSSTNWVKTYN